MIEMVQYNYIRFLYLNKHKSQRAIAKEMGYTERRLKELSRTQNRSII